MTRDDDLDRDLAQWVDELTARYVSQGLPPAEARRRALIDLEGLEQAKERAREASGRGAAWSIDRLRAFSVDVLRGFRSGKATLALAFAILTLTLAAGTVTFSVVDAITLRPLPFADPDRLIAIAHLPRPDGNFEGAASQDYFAWRDETRSFEGLAAAGGSPVLRLKDAAALGEIWSARVTANLFDVLGVRPVVGRLFDAADERPGQDAVVLAHSLWMRAFSGDSNIVGRRIAVTFSQGPRHLSETWQVIGVLPPGVSYPVLATAQPVEVFRPYVPSAAARNHADRGRSYGLEVVGRPRRGVTFEQARADVDRVTASIRATYPHGEFAGGSTVVLPLLDRVAGRAKTWLLLLLAAVGCVVLVGCVNAASLLLARATVRTREFATRAALGASRGRLARTLLSEGLLVTAVAAVAAVVLAYWGVALAKATVPQGLARASSIALNWRVLCAAAAAAAVCGAFVGGAPAWRVARAALFARMKVGGGILGGGRQSRTLGAFLSAEVAFVTVLLVTTTLVVTSFVVVMTADLGFDRRDVMAVDVSKSLAGVPRENRPAAADAFFADVMARAGGVPGVKTVGLVGGPEPLSNNSTAYSLNIPGAGEIDGDEMFETRMVSPDYFAAMGLRVLRGRAFDAGDRADAPRVAAINDLAARRYFPGRDPIGGVITFSGDGRDVRVVGIVQDVRLRGPEGGTRNELYLPLSQSLPPGPSASPSARLIVRTAGPAPAVVPAIREALRPLLSGGTVPEPRLIDDAFRRLTADRRYNASLMSIFGVLTIVIGALGIYGTMAFVVAQQTRAIGLRMALGASQAHVLKSVLRESLVRVGIGAVVGLVAARAIAGVFTSLVFGVQTTSVAVYGGVAVGLLALGLVAALVPALRAARVDPLTALRAE